MASGLHTVIEQLLDRLGAHVMLLTDPADVRWATGFTGSSAMVWIARGQVNFVTDGRYTEQARSEVRSARIHVATDDFASWSAAEGLVPPEARVVFDSEKTTFGRHHTLRTLFPGVTWIPAERMLAANRAAKSDAEVASIRKAQALTEKVFGEVVALIRPGMSEQELAAEITYRHLLGGASGMSFDPIVASGPRSALPHARPSDRRFRQNEPILLDMGCFVDGYASDMTRMVSLGQPDAEFVRVHSCVAEALEAARDAARAGIAAAELDEVARSVLRGHDLADAFTHSLGHGVGLEIHEWPSVSFRNHALLPDGAVVTLEPGVYLEGRFGVRIEDMVQLNASGCDRLTNLSIDLVFV